MSDTVGILAVVLKDGDVYITAPDHMESLFTHASEAIAAYGEWVCRWGGLYREKHPHLYTVDVEERIVIGSARKLA